MADASSKSEGRKAARKHSGLGRGLGALIPQAPEQTSQSTRSTPSRPLDVFFPEGSSARGRGGSAKDLLQPKRAGASSQKKRPAMPPVDAGAAGRKAKGDGGFSDGNGALRRGRRHAPSQTAFTSARMFHVKHLTNDSCCRFPAPPSPRFLSIRSFPTRSSLARCSTRRI